MKLQELQSCINADGFHSVAASPFGQGGQSHSVSFKSEVFKPISDLNLLPCAEVLSLTFNLKAIFTIYKS